MEAVARRIRVHLVLKRITPKTDSRLRSRFLGTIGRDRLVLSVPLSGNHKVCIPVGWEMGMAFPVGQFLLQARTTVLDHCQFQLYPTRRVDGMVVQRPTKILSLNRRSQPRYEVDPSVYIAASLWLADSLAHGEQTDVRSGQLVNWSAGGLGIRFSSNPSCDQGDQMIIRLEKADGNEWPIFRAILRHCTPQDNGEWLAGFSDVAGLGPGQESEMIESLVVP